MVEITEQIVREAPGIEAYKLGLLKQAERLADQPVGVLQFDENGQPITETYQYVDAEGNTQTGTRQQRMLPPQLVAEMSGLQTTALANAEAGIGGYKPYLDEAGFTLGDAQTAIGGVMSGAQPFQTEAAGLMRTGAANVPGQLEAAQQGIQNALASGQMSTAQARAALAQIGAGGQNIAGQSAAAQLAASGQIPGVLNAANTGMGAAALAGGDVAAAARQGGQNIMGTLNPQLAASTDAARGMTSAAAIEALGQAGGAQAGIDAATDAARLQALAGQQALTAAGLQGQQAATQAAQAATLAAQQSGIGTTGVIDAARAQSALGQQAMTAAGERGIGAYEQALGGVGDIMGAARGIAQSARTGGQTAAQQAAADQAIAIQGARGITSQAAQALQQAGALGTTAAQQGIAGLAGTTGAFDPRSAQTFVNQFDDAAVQQALADISRQGQIAQQGVRAQAVGAGAFGGSRQAVAEQELQRNILEQQGRTAGQMRQAGFESAAQRAQAAFEAQQGRAQQAAQLTGGLGAQGAQAGLSAAQAAGQLGLSAEQLAAQSAQQQGQLGLSAEQLAAQTGLSAEQLAQAGVLGAGQLGVSAAQLQGQLAGQAAQMGISAEQLASANAQALAQYGVNLESLAAQTGMSAAQLAGQLAGQAGQLGLQGATAQAGIAQAAGQTGLAGQQLAGQLAGQAGQLGQGMAALGVQGSQQAGALGLQGQELMGRLGEGIGTLGVQYGQLGLQQGDALSTLGLRQAALGEATQKLGQNEAGFLFDMGQKQQIQQQAELEAARASQLQQLYEPYQRVGFLSDIYKGAPSSQQSITGATAPTASTAQQILGLVTAGGSAYAGASKAGLFG